MSTRVAIYARCSTTEGKQDIELQLEPLRDYCIRSKWEFTQYADYASGKEMSKRKEFQSLMSDARKRLFDTVVVTKIDRLSRSMQDFVTTAIELDRLGIRFIALDQGIDTDNSNPTSRLLMNILAAMAEFERELIKERVKSGIAKARKDGVKLGRTPVIFDVEKARELTGKMSYRAAAKSMGVSVDTLIRRVREYTPQGEN